MAQLADKTSLSQHTASDPKKSAWVSANAGSGKTHVLVNRVIRLMLAGTDPSKILALTFTTAAAAEMSIRLNRRLSTWAMLDQEQLKDEIAGLSSEPPSPDQLVRARRLFAHALETPGGLKIQTIHAFCERILHRFALEAGVSPNFDILDGRTGAELLNEARERVFSNLDTDHGIRIVEDLKTVSGALSAADFDNVISQVLKKRTLLRKFHRNQGGIDQVIVRLRQTFGLELHETRTILLDQATGKASPLPAALSGLIELFNSGTAAEKKKSGQLIELRDSVDPEHRYEIYKTLFLTSKGDFRKSLVTKKPGEDNPDKKHFLEDEQERIAALEHKLVSDRIATFTGSLLRIADNILGVYEEAKNARALLDYDDLIQRTADLLSQTHAAAWVLYKLDNGIDHILVDEAQDTNPEHWQVISALTNEFFAGAGAGTTLRTIFAVGDEKQSIYGFQGANPEEFDRMRRQFQRRAAFIDRDFEKVELTVSFRSTAQVLAAVDAVFEQELAGQGMTRLGAAPVHEAFRRGHAGLVEIWPPEMPEEEEPANPWDAPMDYTSPSSPRVRLARKIATTISNWITTKETLTPRGRPIRAGDILILVRRRNNFVDAMVEALKQKNVAVAGVDRMQLSRQLAVMDLLALARFVLLPEDDLNLAVILKGPLFGLDEDTLFELAYQRKSTLWQALSQSRFSAVREVLAALLNTADKIPPYEFFARILNTSGGRQKFIKRLGFEANDPIDEFLSLSLDFENTNVASLQGFVAWFGASEDYIKRDMEHERNEVRIMTVHGAKGLESNIVILPDTCHQVPDPRKQPKLLTTPDIENDPEIDEFLMWRPNKAFENDVVKHSLEHHKKAELQEYNRLLYVAMTRARDRLYIAGYEGKTASSSCCWYQLVFTALEDQAEEILDEHGQVVCWRIKGEQTVDPIDDLTLDAQPTQAKTPPDWARRAVRTEPGQIDLISPSRLGKLEEAAEGDGEEPAVTGSRPSPLQTPPETRYLRGQLIHSLLEYAPGANPDTFGDFSARFLQRAAPSLTTEEHEKIISEVQNVLDQKDLSPLFDPDGLSEVPIVGQVHLAGQEKPVRVSGRIDRLIVQDTRVLAIDFKTDRIIPVLPQSISVSYLRQMAVYRHLLTRIFPDQQIICHLLWTTGPTLMVLPEALLTSALQITD